MLPRTVAELWLRNPVAALVWRNAAGKISGLLLSATLLSGVGIEAAHAQSAQPPRAVAEATVPEGPQGTDWPILPISINGQTVNVIVDVGTTTNLLTVRALRQLDVWLPLDSVKIGTSVQRDEAFDRMGGQVAPGIAGLVGTPILSHYDLVFDGPEKAVRLYPQRDDATAGSPPWFPAGVTQADCVPMTADPQGANRVFFLLEANGRAIHSMFDSGSNTTNINVAAARVLGLSPADSNVKLLPPGVGGQFSRFKGQRIWRVSSATLTVGRHDIVTPINIYEDLPREASPKDGELSLGLDAIRDRVLYVSYSSQTVCVSEREYHAK